MAQKLILPINRARLTASWKTSAYLNRFKVTHYGIDMVSSVGSSVLYSFGDGKVLKTGYDSIFGNFIVLLYPNSYNNKTKEIKDLIVRIFHLASISVKADALITKDTVLGNYGNTGKYSTGAHLHVEVDTDTTHYMYTPTLSGNSSHFIGSNSGANDKTMSNPFEWIHCKINAPDNQTFTTANDIYIRAEDKTITNITNVVLESETPKVDPDPEPVIELTIEERLEQLEKRLIALENKYK